MAVLLVQSCSKSKAETEARLPALDLYSGYFFKIIKKSMREGEFDEQIDIAILSAEHGLVTGSTEIGWYDRRMDAKRAAELAPEVKTGLRERADSYENIVINTGSIYQQAIEPVPSEIKSDVYRIEGDGIGEKGSVLKRLVRGKLDLDSATNLVKYSS
ncbi:DUF6884 domain-containing protein [Halococcoides cellulosivorans]|uniref:DUF6884 domain-containing protein n=1 Tax=Halococcoides cellulosivorans TaxID=1679096 RepID=UPI00131F31F1|nr:DUF6884 domain-containing protein [Halococcoides cellulosivorans]